MSDYNYGWVGKILRVDLSDGTLSEENTAKYAHDFIGGLGLGMKILWDENPAGVDPLDPDNRLVFTTGPLTGTLAPTSGRMEICTKAAGTEPPMCTRSGIGGYWGPELKYAGYDGLIVKGKADGPVYIWIQDGQVEIRDASKLWGLDTYETQKEIFKVHGDSVKTLCIGQAGENLVRFSTIQSETGYSASKIGAGAIMGSKNLKAIAVSGSGGVRIARIAEFIENSRVAWEFLHDHPIREFTTEGPINRVVSYARKYRKKFVSCQSCPANCRTWIDFPGLDGGEAMCAGGWWYLFIGCRDEKAIWEAKLLLDKYGLDAHTLLDLVRWFQAMFKSGVITEEQTGIPWSEFGSSEFVNKLVNKITFREGFGDIMAEGPVRILPELKPDASDNIGYFFPAYGQSEHYELRAYPMYLMQWAFDSRDPLVDAHDWSTFHAWQHYSWPLVVPGHLTEEQLAEIGKEVYKTEKAFDPHSYDDKPQVTCMVQNSSRLKNSLVLCDWLFPVYASPNNTEHYKGDPDIERNLFCQATGIEMDEDTWYQTGERIFNLERALLVRDNNRSREHDTVDRFHFEVPVTKLQPWEPQIEPMTADRENFEKAKSEYYGLRGWDVASGRPTREKLESLNLTDVANELGKSRLLP